MHSTDTSTAIDRWVETGIISAEQATRIRADVAAHKPRHTSLVSEALGYLGGIIVLVGLGLALGFSWDRLDTAGRLGVAAATTLALLAAGLPIPIARLGATGTRLRGVLWAAGTIGAAATLGLYGDEVLNWDSSQVALLWSGGAFVVAALSWVFNRHTLQRLATIAFLLIAAFWATDVVTQSLDVGSATQRFLPDLAVWVVGVVWLVLALLSVIRRADGVVLGALGTTIGGVMMLEFYWGPLFALGTVIALVVAAVALRELAVLAIASVGTLIALPIAVNRYLPGEALWTALAVVGAGLALVATGVFTARRNREPSPVA